MSYRFRMDGIASADAGAPKQPVLALHLSFDLGRMVRDADDGFQAALARYGLVAAQLADPAVALVLDTTVLPGEAARVASTDDLRPALAAFVDAVVAELRAAEGGGTANQVVSEAVFAVNAAAVARRSDDLFAIGVRLTLSRHSGEAPTSTTFDVAAALKAGSTAESREDGSGGDAGVAAWARDFEEAFAGFDGAEGRLCVLSRTDSPADTAPSLWALRSSRAAGVWMEFARDEAAYFTFAPLSTRLISGSAQITEYDPATLKPERESTVILSSVDLDAWGEAFLLAMDSLLSPRMAAAIALLDHTAYAELRQRQAQMARALSQRLVPVYADASAGGVNGGDVDAARGASEQALLDSLLSAYSTSAVVQVPASMQLAGEGNEGASSLFGSVAARDETQPEYSGSTGTLPLKAAMDAPPLLTFMVSAAEPGRASVLAVAAAYEVRGLVNRFPHDPDAGSQRLELVLTEGADAMVLPLQPLRVPVPLRGFPVAPVPIGQTATGASGPSARDADPIRGALEWDYTAEVATPVNGAQDDLWVEIAYNLPVDSPPAGATADEQAGALTGLFQALAAFQAAWPALAPLLARIPEPDVSSAGGPSAQAVVTAATALIASVTDHWTALEGTAEPAAVPSSPAPATGTDEFVIGIGRAATGQLDVFARPGIGSEFDPARAEQWPSIDGQGPAAAPVALPAGEGPDPAGGWYRGGYAFNASDTMMLRWSALGLFTRQTARSMFRVVRNATLLASAPLRTSDALVYRTAPVGFATPVLPRTEVVRIGPLPTCSTLAEALAQVLRPVSQAATAAVKERQLAVSVSYDYPLATDGAARMVTNPLLQTDGIQLGSGVESIDTLAAALAREVTTWHRLTGPPTEGAILCLRVVLFAAIDGTRQPLVQLQRVEIAVPPGWWSS